MRRSPPRGVVRAAGCTRLPTNGGVMDTSVIDLPAPVAAQPAPVGRNLRWGATHARGHPPREAPAHPRGRTPLQILAGSARVRSFIQLTSQVLPSTENACSQWALIGVICDQM